MTHDYKRNGTTTLSSPLSISSKVRSSAAACSATGTRNSSAFSMPSSAKCRGRQALDAIH